MQRHFHKLYTTLFITLALLCSQSFAQQQNTTTPNSVIMQPQTPAGFAKGTPALGSYGGSNFDQVNLYNGNLSITLPLASLLGRDGMNASVVLSYNSKIWHLLKHTTKANKSEGTLYIPTVEEYDRNVVQIAPGWVLHTGSMRARYSHFGLLAGIPSNQTPVPQQTLTTITFTAPDGTEHDFIDDKTNGLAHDYSTTDFTPFSRGTIFKSTDSSAAIFVSDTPIIDKFIGDSFAVSGTVYLKDGTKFIVNSSSITQEINPNGNVITYSYGVPNPQQGRIFNNALTRIEDNLGRFITIAYKPSPDILLTITSQGINNIAKTITVYKGRLVDNQRDGNLNTPPTIGQLFPGVVTQANGATEFNPRVVTSIKLPSNHTWEFTYNSYGEITGVKTPTGGEIDYEYGGNIEGLLTNTGEASLADIFRRVLSRTTYPTGKSNGREGTTNYTNPHDNSDAGFVTETHINNNNQTLATTIHKFVGSPETSVANSFANSINNLHAQTDWILGKEIRTTETDTNPNTKLKKTEYTYRQQNRDLQTNSQVTGDHGSQENDLFSVTFQAPNNPHLVETLTTLIDTNEVSKVHTDYDQFSNVITENVFDFGSGQPGSLLRQTLRTYITDPAYIGAFDSQNHYTGTFDSQGYPNDINAHIVGLPETETIKNGSTTETTSKYSYDDPNLLVSANTTNLPGRKPAYNFTSYITRGNLTKKIAGFGSPDETASTIIYDVLGNMVEMDGPQGEKTTMSYADNTSAQLFFAYPTSVTKLVSGGNTQTPFNLTSSTTYDQYTGAVMSATGFNGETITYSYDDPLDRLTQEMRPLGFGQTNYTYSLPSQPTKVTIVSKLDSRNITATNEFDGLLRTTKQTRNDVGGQSVTAETTYDGLGRVSSVTNPHRSAAFDTTDGLTTTTYDGLSRVRTVNTTDTNSNSTGIVTTDYLGTTVTVTDQAGKQRKSKTDGLGRLTKVTEPLPSGVLGQDTTYDYDARGNLLQVHQGVQTRSFSYDALSRLKTATAPESGTINYTYDLASNLHTRTDNRGVLTQYDYDSLERITAKTYSDGTPGVKYFYDHTSSELTNLPPSFSDTFGLGRLLSITTAANTALGQQPSANFYQYDIGGRTTKSDQLLDGQFFHMQAQYNQISLPVQWQHPSSASLTYTYNDAGQISNINRNGTTLASGIQYTASGAVSQQTLGNGLLHSMTYNSRLQPTIVNLGTTAIPDNTFKLSYDYGLQSVDMLKNATVSGYGLDNKQNNGNIGRIRVTHGTGAQTFEQNFGYDELNRLKIAKEFTATIDITASLGASSNTSIGINTVWTTSITNADSFTLERSTDGVNFQVLTSVTAQPNQNRYSFTDVGSYATTYSYRVKAISNNVASDYSNISFVVTPVGPPPPPPDDCQICIESGCSADGCYSFLHQSDGYPCCQIIIKQPSDDNGAGNSNDNNNNDNNNKAANQTTTSKAKGDDIQPLDSQSVNWKQEYSYDRYGNRLNVNDLTGDHSLSISDTNNRITTTGVTYDLAGNVTTDTNGNIYTYDAENRMITAMTSQGMAKYFYDGSGKRIEKMAIDPSFDPMTPVITRYVYDGSGRLAAEYQGNTTPIINQPTKEYVYGAAGMQVVIEPNETDPDKQIQYLTSDHLGSPRVITDAMGNVISRRDFFPFGEEMLNNEGARNNIFGFPALDNIKQHFATYERDIETGLDFAQARYFSSMQGRFLSPDPFDGSAKVESPQTWNRYAYVENNPINSNDPTGLEGPGATTANDLFNVLPNINPSNLAAAGAFLTRLTPAGIAIGGVIVAGYLTYKAGASAEEPSAATRYNDAYQKQLAKEAEQQYMANSTKGANNSSQTQSNTQSNSNASANTSTNAQPPDNQGKGKGKNNPYKGQSDSSLLDSRESYKELEATHVKKLADYKANPYSPENDNKGKLQNAPTQAIKDNIIRNRIIQLEADIKKHRGELQKIDEEIKSRGLK